MNHSMQVLLHLFIMTWSMPLPCVTNFSLRRTIFPSLFWGNVFWQLSIFLSSLVLQFLFKRDSLSYLSLFLSSLMTQILFKTDLRFFFLFPESSASTIWNDFRFPLPQIRFYIFISFSLFLSDFPVSRFWSQLTL